MEQIRLIPASLHILFSPIEGEDEAMFNCEFERFSEIERDPIGQWYKKQKAKGDIDKQNESIITLLVELHRKVDELSKTVSGDNIKPIELTNSVMIDAIGYEYFRVSSVNLNAGRYYGRVFLPVFPERLIPIFFQINKNEQVATIIKMHVQDHNDWDGFVISKERQHIQDARDLSARNAID